VIVPTLRVGMLARTLRVDVDAERQSLLYHAERGNDQQPLKYWFMSRGSEFIRDAVIQTIEVRRIYLSLANECLVSGERSTVLVLIDAQSIRNVELNWLIASTTCREPC
jgi:hypothetical protein